MPTKYNNMLTIRLSDEQLEYLADLSNNIFCIDSMADAVRFCINSEMHYSKMGKELVWSETNEKLEIKQID